MGRFSDLLAKETGTRHREYAAADGAADPKDAAIEEAAGLDDLLPNIGRSKDATAVGLQKERLAVNNESRPVVRGSRTVPNKSKRKSLKGYRRWMVTNDELFSNSSGLTYRRSPDLEDKAFNGFVVSDEKIEKWGNCVRGSLINEDWLKVGSLYLPVKVDDVVVLRPYAEKMREMLQDESAGDMIQQWKHWKMPLAKKLPARAASTGHLYEVVHDRVVGRPAPSMAAPMQAVKMKGDAVVLFEYDQRGLWRKGLDTYTNQEMWWLIDHEKLGPLLRPKGMSLSIKPLEPLCVAAQENLIADLERLLDLGFEVDIYDVSGRTPLMIALEADNLECCILLLEGGASPNLEYKGPSPHAGKSTIRVAKRLASEKTLTVLQAILGHKNIDYPKLEEICLFHLPPGYEDIVMNLARANQKPSNKEPEGSTPSKDEVPMQESGQVLPAANAQPKKPEIWEVVHDIVFIRKEPSMDSEKVSVRRAGDALRLLEIDSTGTWARASIEVYRGMNVTGWVLIKHPNFGDLLRPAGGSAEPEDWTCVG